MNLFRKKTKSDERRSQFRNKLPHNGFEATLRQGDTTTFEVAILDLASGGAQVRLNPGCADALKIEDSIVLELVLSNPGRLVELTARIRNIEGNQVNMQFIDSEFDAQALDAESRMLLSRRKHLRHRLREHVPVDLTIGNVVVTGTLHDVSEGGVGVQLENDLAGDLAVDHEVEIEFVLPDSITPCVIHGLVRHRTPRDGALCFGLQFQSERDDQLNPVRDFLSRAPRR